MKDVIGNIIGAVIIAVFLTVLLLGIFWKPIMALYLYHDWRCVVAECRIQK